jgi:hypothetical protein
MYEVSFATLVQHNTVNGGRRRVRRVPLAPGVQPPLFEEAMAAYQLALTEHRAALASPSRVLAAPAEVRCVPTASSPARALAGAGAAGPAGASEGAAAGAGSSTDGTGVCIARCAAQACRV